MIKYVFLFFPQPKQAPNQTDTQCVHQTFSHRRGALIGLPLLQDRGIRNAGRLFFALRIIGNRRKTSHNRGKKIPLPKSPRLFKAPPQTLYLGRHGFFFGFLLILIRPPQKNLQILA